MRRQEVKMFNEFLSMSVYKNRVLHNIKKSRLLYQGVVLTGELVDKDFVVYSNVYELCRAKGCTRASVIRYISPYLKSDYVEASVKLCTSPDGRIFRSTNAMCVAYGISVDAYRSRLLRGSNIFDSLVKPVRECIHNQEFTGPDGEIYPSIQAMLRKFSISSTTFYKRMQNGLSMTQCLVPIVHDNFKPVIGTLNQDVPLIVSTNK